MAFFAGETEIAEQKGHVFGFGGTIHTAQDNFVAGSVQEIYESDYLKVPADSVLFEATVSVSSSASNVNLQLKALEGEEKRDIGVLLASQPSSASSDTAYFPSLLNYNRPLEKDLYFFLKDAGTGKLPSGTKITVRVRYLQL